MIQENEEKGHWVKIDHEIFEVLQYDGEKCETSKDYSLIECRIEQIQTVKNYYDL